MSIINVFFIFLNTILKIYSNNIATQSYILLTKTLTINPTNHTQTNHIQDWRPGECCHESMDHEDGVTGYGLTMLRTFLISLLSPLYSDFCSASLRSRSSSLNFQSATILGSADVAASVRALSCSPLNILIRLLLN